MNQARDQSLNSGRVSRRELLGYAQAVAFLLVMLLFAIASIQFSLPHPEWIDLGTMAEFTRETPTPRIVNMPAGSDLAVWVVYVDGEFLAFDQYTPYRGRCRYQWQPVTQRFEDPCSGVKFSRLGEFVDPYYQFAGRSVQNLDRYVVDARDGHVFVNANRIIRGDTFLAPTRTPIFECC